MDTKIDATEFILFFSIRVQNWVHKNVATMTNDIKFNVTKNTHHLSYLKIIKWQW